MLKKEQLLYYAVVYHGAYQKIKRAIERNEKWMELKYQEKYISIFDKEYPNQLKELTNPPWILFYRGDLSLLECSSVAIIGSRLYSEYGKAICEHLSENLARRQCIVSGLARGIDAIAHQTAIEYCGKTIAIIGCGLDVIYPKENEWIYQEIGKNHLLLSEYPNGVMPLALHFPHRNRLIAALAHTIIVIEARVKSGTMLTINEALELNKDIYCVPHRLLESSGEGCNRLIQEGAQIITNLDDLKHLM